LRHAVPELSAAPCRSIDGVQRRAVAHGSSLSFSDP
jgi:hypothetical protein